MYLKIKPKLAPYKAAVFPLLRNKEELVKKAREVYETLRKNSWWHGMTAEISASATTRRMRSAHRIASRSTSIRLKKGDVTVRDRDTAKQERIKIEDLEKFLAKKLE